MIEITEYQLIEFQIVKHIKVKCSRTNIARTKMHLHFRRTRENNI